MRTSTSIPVPGHRSAVLPRVTIQARSSLILVAVSVLAILLALAQVLVPSNIVPANALATAFSAERAIRHLQIIAQQPHFVGSPAQTRVRTYLLQEIQALGLQPEVQETTGAVTNGRGVFASNLQNILVRIPGTQSSGVVAIMAHYDTQPNTTGASDNGVAVAGILEAMRAIQAGPRLRNDLLFILTDAEEVDAQGADAFFWQHPWAKEIRLLVNFEAAGDSGASILLETSSGNDRLVAGYAQAVAHPIAHSFMTQLLTLLPLGTDMSVFAEHGIPSLSPMFGWHYRTIYHSMLDNVNALDPRSVQHQGENALGLARYFGNQDLTNLTTSEDAVFFTLWPGLVVQYPAGWAVPLALLAGLLLAGSITLGLRRSRLRVRGMLAGVALALAGVLVPLILAALVWMGIVWLHPDSWRILMGAPYQADLYLVGFVALTIAASIALFLLARRKVTAAHLTVGALVLWFIPALLTSFYLPGMSYFFTWPVIVTALVLGGMVLLPRAALDMSMSGTAKMWAWPVGLMAAAVLIILVVVPTIILVYMLLGFWAVTMQPMLSFIVVSMLLVALLLAVLAPQIDLLTRTWRWRLPGLAAVLAVGVLVAGSLLSGFNAAQPLPNGVWYELNAGTGQAVWYSYGEKPADPWTAQFFPGAVEPVNLNAIYAATPGNPMPPAAFKGPAAAAVLPAPEVSVLSDQVVGHVRQLHLHLASPRQARGLRVEVQGTAVLSATVNGNRQTNPDWHGQPAWFLRFYGLTGQGLDLQLEMVPSQTVTLVVTDQSDGLPALPGSTLTPRTPAMMPFAMAQEYMPYPDTTSVSKTFQIP